ncbi:MAG: TolC family protein [Alphaproteobacteria bacterium]|nr:TolC family protein [Alphaproteobacteria bacterium]
MAIRSLILTFLILFSAASANAETSDAKNFDMYVQRLAEHPQVTQILEQGTRFKELSDGEMGLPDPNIILGVDNLPVNDPAFDQFLPSSKVIGFKQQIPSYSLRKAKSERQEELSAKQQLIADYTMQRLKAMLTSMLASLDKVKQQEAYAKKQLEHYKSLEEYFKGRLESGSGVYWRFSEVDVERSLVESKLNDLKAERDDIEAELVRLVGEVPAIPLPNIPQVTWDSTAESVYPVLIAKEDIDIADKDVDAADAAFGPDYGVQAIYKQRESGANFRGDDWFSVQATISIPLWYEWNQKPKLRAAEASKRSAENAYDDTGRMWKRKLDALASKRDATLDNVMVFVEKDKALDEMVAAAERTYEAGETNLDTVLDAQINQLTIKSQLAEKRAQHLMLAAEFNSHIIGDK